MSSSRPATKATRGEKATSVDEVDVAGLLVLDCVELVDTVACQSPQKLSLRHVC